MERKTGLSVVAATAMGADENRECGQGQQAGHALVLRVRGLKSHRAIACPESLLSHVERLTECAVEQFVEDGGSAWRPTQHLGDREIGQAEVHHQRTSERT